MGQFKTYSKYGLIGNQKKSGVKRGVADISIFIPNNKYHGLFLELKSYNGKLKPDQIAFGESMAKVGFKYVVVYTLAQAINTFLEYLDDSPYKNVKMDGYKLDEVPKQYKKYIKHINGRTIDK